MITPKYLDELDRLCEAATDGPFDYDDGCITSISTCERLAIVHDFCTEDEDLIKRKADAKLFAESRQAIPALVAEVRRLSDIHAKLEQYAEDSIGCQYGTISADLVLRLVKPEPPKNANE